MKRINNYTLPSATEARKRTKEKVNIKRELFLIEDEFKELGQNKTFYLRTYGCQANFRDSETIAGILNDLKFKQIEDMNSADLIILNTCAIRKNAEDKVLGELGYLKKVKRDNPNCVIALCGCMAQEEEMVNHILSKYPQVDLIFGTHNIYNLPKLLYSAYNSNDRTVEVFSKEGDIIEDLPSKRDLKHKAWVNISYGCNKFCSYCIVPYTRGKERSRLLEDILKEVRDLKNNGYKEVCLLGQNVNSYGLDLDLNHGFATLLEEVANTGIERIRFMTPHPYNFDDETIDICAKYPNIMPSIHLPLQSGSDEILRKMNRKYNSEQYRILFDKLKNKIENCSFTTDIIVGFPNESDEDFLDTLKMVDYCKYDNAFTFIYSKREGTPASVMEDSIPLSVKEERLQVLNSKIATYAKMQNMKYQDQVVEVLVDGKSKRDSEVYSGYTPQNKLVNFIGENISVGDIYKIKVINAKSFSLDGKKIEE